MSENHAGDLKTQLEALLDRHPKFVGLYLLLPGLLAMVMGLQHLGWLQPLRPSAVVGAGLMAMSGVLLAFSAVAFAFAVLDRLTGRRHK